MVNLDSPGSLVLEADAVQPLVKVDGVLTGHHLKMSVHTTKFEGNPLRPKSSLVTFIDYAYYVRQACFFNIFR